MNKQVLPMYRYLSLIKHSHVLSLQKLAEDWGETEWWEENNNDMSDGCLFLSFKYGLCPFDIYGTHGRWTILRTGVELKGVSLSSSWEQVVLQFPWGPGF